MNQSLHVSSQLSSAHDGPALGVAEAEIVRPAQLNISRHLNVTS